MMKLPERKRSIIGNPMQLKRIKEEGNGAYSTVDLVLDPHTKETYALKIVFALNNPDASGPAVPARPREHRERGGVPLQYGAP